MAIYVGYGIASEKQRQEVFGREEAKLEDSEVHKGRKERARLKGRENGQFGRQ